MSLVRRDHVTDHPEDSNQAGQQRHRSAGLPAHKTLEKHLLETLLYAGAVFDARTGEGISDLQVAAQSERGKKGAEAHAGAGDPAIEEVRRGHVTHGEDVERGEALAVQPVAPEPVPGSAHLRQPASGSRLPPQAIQIGAGDHEAGRELERHERDRNPRIEHLRGGGPVLAHGAPAAAGQAGG